MNKKSILPCLVKILAVFSLIGFLVSCGGGGSSSGDNNAGGETQQFGELTNVLIKYSDTPTQYKDTTISLITDEDVGEVDWVVMSEPPMSNLVLSKTVDNKTVSFVASEPGDYQIVARSNSNNTEKSTSFTISPIFAFDESKIEGNDGLLNIDEIFGRIQNQSWVHSFSLTENELRDVVANYSSFTIVGYDSIEGLLIEYDETDIAVIDALEELKLERGVSSVVNRVYEGENALISNVITPNDGSGFNDGGDNWHLEEIGATNAWEYTTGSSDILIGITDGFGLMEHSELVGRIAEAWSSGNAKNVDHGDAVAGAIGAKTDNSVGISGINWVSRMITIPMGFDNVKSLLAKNRPVFGEVNVAIVNNSWGPDIPDDFDSTIFFSVPEPNEEIMAYTRPYRKLAQSNKGKLLVWSAGNGIKNGEGNGNGVYGMDGRHYTPAMHYDDDGTLSENSKLDNVLFVAALRNDSRLAFYSNYGPSVDIAAPTSYKSLSIDGGFFTDTVGSYGDGVAGFYGTSAAAPVVTGVASLVYSLYSGFTGKEVKDILISTATEFVTQRYIAPEDTRVNNSNIETLAHKIPILNAGKALEKAQEIVDSKITLKDTIPDPFTPQAQILFKSIDEDMEVVSLEWELQSSIDSGAPWIFVSRMTVDGNVAEPMLDSNIFDYRLVTTVTLRNRNSNIEVTSNSAYEFGYSKFRVNVGELQVINTDILDPLVGVTFEVEPLLDSPFTQTSLTGIDGLVTVYLKSGVYKLRGNLAGYDEVVSLLIVDEPKSKQLDLHMTSTKTVGLLQIKHPVTIFLEVGLLDEPTIFGNLLCLANNDTKIAIPDNPEDLCDSLDTPNTADPSLHKCPTLAPWLRLDPADVSCSVEGNPSVYVNLGSVEYTGDISGFSHYLKNTTSGVTRIIDNPDLLNGKTVCWAVANTPIVFQGEVNDLQLAGVKWAEIDYSGIDLWVGQCKKDQRGYVGVDTVFSN